MNRILAFTLILFVFGCQESEEKNPDKILKNKDVPVDLDLGEANNGIYVNKYFGLSFEYDEEWFLQDHETLEKLVDRGAEIAKDQLKESVEASIVRTASLFGAFKFDPAKTTGFNPSLMVMIENVKGDENINYGDEYLEQIRELWPQLEVDVKQRGTITEAYLDGKEAYKMIAEIKAPSTGIVTQEYYCTIYKNFALVFAISYESDSERNELKRAIESIRFKK